MLWVPKSVRNISGGGGRLKAQAPVGGTLIDPGGIVNGGQAGVTTSGRFTRLLLQNPATVTDTPEEMARFRIALKDLYGRQRSLVLGDMFQMMLWAEDVTPAQDRHIFVSCTVGNLSGTSFGIAARLRWVTGAPHRWGISHGINTGASWAWTDEVSATSASTRGLVLQLIIGTDDSQARVNVFPIDAAGLPIGTANSETTPATMTGWTVNPNTIEYGAGWMTGVGGGAGTVGLSPRVLFVKRANIANTVL